MRQVFLNIHGIGEPGRPLEPGEAPYWISVDLFDDTLDIIATMRGKIAVELTFDDGNASDIEIAAPRLAAAGLRAALFVLAGRLDTPGSLSSADLVTLGRMGHEIGLHGWAHVDWTAQDDAALHREIDMARARIAEAAGAPVRAAAIPFGRYDRRVLNSLRRSGLERVLTSDGGPLRPGLPIVPRTSLRADMDASAVRRIIEGPEPPLVDLRRRMAMLVKRSF